MERMAKNEVFAAQQGKIIAAMAKVKHPIIVMSGKGGVGKTSVAVNLAYALSVRGKSTGIVDIDLHGPNIAKMLGIEDETIKVTDRGMQPVHVSQNLSAISIALLGHHPDQPMVWRGPMKAGVIRQFLSDVDWGELDYLIIDAPPGTGDEPLSAVQSIPNIKGAIIVTTPQDVAVLDSRKSVVFTRDLGVPVIGIVENMSGCVCPYCNKDITLFGSGGGEKAAQELAVPFLGRIPFEQSLVAYGDKGTPFMSYKEVSKASQAFMGIVDKIEAFVKG